MSLVKTKDILKHATENRYGVAAINVINFETIKYAIKAAEMERVPIIIQFFPGFDTHIPVSHVAWIAKDLAKKATVPVGVHLDHSAGFDIALNGIKGGFPSVMVDGSSLPYEENVQLTKEVVKAAQVFDVDIEAELGHVGVGANEEDMDNSDLFTNPDQAVDFIERTHCDSLAIAVGHAHGAYIKQPNLDFDRIREIRSKVDIPLVLHGCSGIPDEQMKEAVNLGMSKFNVATEYFNSMYQGILDLTKDEKTNGISLLMDLEEPMVSFVRSKIRLLNPNKYSIK